MNQAELGQWHRDERESLIRQIESYTSGRLDSRGLVDGRMASTSDEAVARLRKRLAELERFLAE